MHPGPPGWGFSLGPTTLTGKTTYVTEAATKENYTDVDGAFESQPGTFMTVSNESRQEAADTTKDALNTVKTRMKVGFWNVQTMYDTGRLAQVTSEMRRYNLHVMGISESRWTGTGSLKTITGETVFYSGRDDEQHREGVAVILKKGVEKCLLEWKPVNSRLMKVRLKGTPVIGLRRKNARDHRMRIFFTRASPRKNCQRL